VLGITLRQAQHRKGLYHLMNETINPGILSECAPLNGEPHLSVEKGQNRPLYLSKYSQFKCVPGISSFKLVFGRAHHQFFCTSCTLFYSTFTLQLF